MLDLPPSCDKATCHTYPSIMSQIRSADPKAVAILIWKKKEFMEVCFFSEALSLFTNHYKRLAFFSTFPPIFLNRCYPWLWPFSTGYFVVCCNHTLFVSDCEGFSTFTRPLLSMNENRKREHFPSLAFHIFIVCAVYHQVTNCTVQFTHSFRFPTSCRSFPCEVTE